MIRAYVSFGSNIDPDRNVPGAIGDLARRVRIVRVSPVYDTPPVGVASPPFVNGVILLETDLSAAALRDDVLRPIEAAWGRVRTGDANAPRTIDLDLLILGEETIQDPARHAHLAVPMADLDPGFAGIAERFAAERTAFRRRGDLESRVAEKV